MGLFVGVKPTPSSPAPSAVSETIAASNVKTPQEALAIEVMHNLKYQHKWTDLTLHSIAPAKIADESRTTSPSRQSTQAVLVAGLPPRHAYLHPDFTSHLIMHDIQESSVPVQREWVLPMSIGQKSSLKDFAGVFDALPARVAMTGHEDYEWKDAKRILLAMLAHNGMGGDGTVAYYVMQEGEVKPRQNG